METIPGGQIAHQQQQQQQQCAHGNKQCVTRELKKN